MDKHWDVVVVGAGMAGLTARTTAAARSTPAPGLVPRQPGPPLPPHDDRAGDSQRRAGRRHLRRRGTGAVLAVHVEDGRVGAVHVIVTEDKLAALDLHLAVI